MTTEEEKMYDGEYGWACQISMRILTRLGDLFSATKLIPIKSAHLSGVSYKTLGDAPIEFLEELAKTAGKARVEVTLNPSSLDPNLTKFSRNKHEKQRQIIGLYKKMGADPTLTCTPYYLKQPLQGFHFAWAESSAVVYANSVLGVYTNREGSPSALAAALVGKTPDYGMHRPENREPAVLVNVETRLRNEAEFGALGIRLGNLLNDKIPLLKGLPKHDNDDLKQLGAAMATAGMTTIFQTGKPVEKTWQEKVSVEREDIENTMESLSTTAEQPDLVFLGCPHCSIEELEEAATFLEGKRVKDNLRLWICTSRWLKEKAENYVNIVEEAGGHVVCDTCAIVTWLRDLGINSVMTNSAKTAYYAPTMNKVDALFASLSECLETACL
ncbi:MAG: aconitase X catalytic domain-containing protein [Candidatus Bathyarchaeota archaeon]|nr:aconitase X catalytic domain-containing protein [Candidatus Bathyarchaeota archaeon]